MSALDVFRGFLVKHKIAFEDATSLSEIVAANYSLLDDTLLRSLINAAIEERDAKLAAGGKDSELLGTWGVVIDAVQSETLKRRESAAQHFQQVCALAASSASDDTAMQAYLQGLRRGKHLDHVFCDLVSSSLQQVQSSGNVTMTNLLQRIQAALQLVLHTPTTNTIPVAIRDAEAEEQQRFMEAGSLLQLMLRQCGGDMKQLTLELTEKHRAGLIDNAFERVLCDNISACEAAGYANKTQVLRYMSNHIQMLKSAPDKSTQPDASDYSIVHAPHFIMDAATSGEGSREGEELSEEFIDAAGAFDAKIKNTKKKAEKNAAKRRIASVAKSLGDHLQQHGWAVCDHFLPLDLVRRVRIEACLFQEHYESSEIWVGKGAAVGAQISVKSVRGDRVLWMCGGHRNNPAAPEGESRAVRTIGEIEPCKLEVKAAAPIRKFTAMKDLLAAIDVLVDQLKVSVPELQGVYERSDAMLAVYPGEGARFAKHIDNTTADGRRLTVLVYLNPGWRNEDGGALRVYDPEQNKHIDVLPDGGRIALFYSATIPHEVLPTQGMRHALTVWYYDKEERRAAHEKAKAAGTTQQIATASVEVQREAKQFVAALMGGDDVPADGGNPTIDELVTLQENVQRLSQQAVEIVSAITGAPSTASFLEGFPLLTVADLKSMRSLFRRMGLQG